MVYPYIDSLDWRQRWPHFLPAEVLSPHGLDTYIVKKELLINPASLDFLEAFRVRLARPLVVNFDGHRHRGYRSPEENKIVGGTPGSYHMKGMAFDVTCLNVHMTLYDLLVAAREFGWKGLGFYPRRNFVHMDTRPTAAFWTG